jgi:hypothetical protein
MINPQLMQVKLVIASNVTQIVDSLIGHRKYPNVTTSGDFIYRQGLVGKPWLIPYLEDQRASGTYAVFFHTRY